jgi:hypothetical protein
MRALVRLAVVAVLAAATSGCITAVTTIKLRPDGSGTIDQVLSMNAAAAAQFAEMAKSFGGGDKGGSAEPEFFSEKEMKEAATKFGEGVTFVSSKPIKTADRVGRIATYQFADIGRLRIEQKPQTGDMPGASETSAKEDVLFRFARRPAGTSLLTVVFPEAKFDEARKKAQGKGQDDDDGPQKVDPAQLEMMKKLFDGLKIAIDVEVLGTIVKTNSPFVQGSKVTLLEMDFAELIANDKLLAQVGEPKSIEEAKRLLKDVKGFKVNLDREVMIEFR